MNSRSSENVEETVFPGIQASVPWILFIIFFSVLNETVFNVSTPAIAAEFGLTPAGVSWVMSTFIVFFGVGTVIYGKLADIFSLKRLIVIGILIYCGASIAGFVLQHSYPAVIAARAVQGAGASAIPALVTVFVARYFPASERGRVFGYITSDVAFAIGIGPVIGGFVSSTLHWSYLFVVPLFTLVSLPYLRKLLPAESRRAGSIDVLGAFLVAGAVGSFVLYLSFLTWYFLAAGIVLLGAFVVDVARSPNPFIAPHLFRNGVFRKRSYVGFILFASATGVLFVIPLMLSALRGLTTSQIGLVLFPGALSAVVFGAVAGNLADRRGNTFVFAIGLVLLAVSFLAMSSLVAYSPWMLAVALLPSYIGFSFSQTALVNSVSQILAVEEMGVGMGLFNLLTFVSGAVGTAIIGRYLAGGWLSFAVNPLVHSGRAFTYSNLLLVLLFAVLLAGTLYALSLRGRGPLRSAEHGARFDGERAKDSLSLEVEGSIRPQ